MNMYRHGDLLIRQINKLPEGMKAKTNIIAKGEFTGQNHVLTCERPLTIIDYEGKKFFEAIPGTEITHPEHKTIPIEIGYYEVVIEQEFNPFEQIIKQVQD